MNASIHALLDGIVDYAGLFPPARLDMTPVVANYGRYLGGPHAWMLGRLIIPTARFGEFADAFEAQGAAGGRTWRISALGAGGDDAAQIAERVGADVAAIGDLQNRLGRSVIVDAYENRLPAGLIAGGDDSVITELAADAVCRFSAAGLAIASAAFEIGFPENWRDAVPGAIAALAAGHRRDTDSGGQTLIAAKIRTGGVEAHMFPDCEKVAAFMAECQKNHLPFKATAGLHHPIRHFNDSVQTIMHGFINVFAAAAIGCGNKLSEDALRSIIEDESTGSFKFDDGGLAWNDQQVDVNAIKSARKNAALGFGSCSFQEPIEDLVHLGWL